MEADSLKRLIFERTGIQSDELSCPREKSFMTPCVVRDGDLAMAEGKVCVGCGASVIELLNDEKQLHETST